MFGFNTKIYNTGFRTLRTRSTTTFLSLGSTSFSLTKLLLLSMPIVTKRLMVVDGHFSSITVSRVKNSGKTIKILLTNTKPTGLKTGITTDTVSAMSCAMARLTSGLD